MNFNGSLDKLTVMTTMMRVTKLILMCSDQRWNFCPETDFVWYIKLGILLFIARQDPVFS